MKQNIITRNADIEEVWKKAVKTYGKDVQLRQLQEECAELIVAVNKYFRNPSEKTKQDILEESADVQNLFNQLEYIFEDNSLVKTVGEMMAKKAIRLNERLLGNNIDKYTFI